MKKIGNRISELEQKFKSKQGDLGARIDGLGKEVASAVTEKLNVATAIKDHPLPILGGALAIGVAAGLRGARAHTANAPGLQERQAPTRHPVTQGEHAGGLRQVFMATLMTGLADFAFMALRQKLTK